LTGTVFASVFATKKGNTMNETELNNQELQFLLQLLTSDKISVSGQEALPLAIVQQKLSAALQDDEPEKKAPVKN